MNWAAEFTLRGETEPESSGRPTTLQIERNVFCPFGLGERFLHSAIGEWGFTMVGIAFSNEGLSVCDQNILGVPAVGFAILRYCMAQKPSIEGRMCM